MEENRYVEYCKQLVAGLCKDSPDLGISNKIDDMGVFLLVTGVAQSDMANVIGTKGAHVNAIRLLVRSVGLMEGARVSLKIAEPGETEYHGRREEN